ncbi:MAG: hypothetical protein Q4B30_06965 [Coriobacteriaceae bacterium]|nr:hypothetical protein [Coriobacteriaceae bacterium]
MTPILATALANTTVALNTAAMKYVPVMAKITGSATLQKVVDMLSGGITFLGGGMIVWGAISVGVNIREGSSGNGSAVASSVGMIVGGAVIIAAAVFFKGLDLDWASGAAA